MESKGSICKRVEDANFNIQHGRYEAALALLLIAVDGSARKMYPEGTKSIKYPGNKMGNKERYTRFLGVRLREIFGISMHDRDYYQGELPDLVNSIESPEDKIYTSFRCNELHESGLPEELQYVYEPNGISNTLSLDFMNGEVHFSSGFLRLLEVVITGAPCNGDEFGIKHYRLITNDGSDVLDYINKIGMKNGVTPCRINIMMQLIQFVGPNACNMCDEDLAKTLTKLLDSKMPGGARTGLCSPGWLEPGFAEAMGPLCDQKSGINSNGVKIARVIMESTHFIDFQC